MEGPNTVETRTNWQCERCGASVSPRFVRVFGKERSVYGCIDCLSSKALFAGEATEPEGEG
jgi:hypothetical protein